jgi:hypothetical protein
VGQYLRIRSKYASMLMEGICRAWNESNEERWFKELFDAVNNVSARPVVGEVDWRLVGSLGFRPIEGAMAASASEKRAVVGDGCAGFKAGFTSDWACPAGGLGVEVDEVGGWELDVLESALDLVPLLELFSSPIPSSS